jgi:hypothetical protein
MSSNYPPGVSSSTFSAPWNDEEREFEFYIKVSGVLYTDGPLPDLIKDEIFADMLVDEKKEILKCLNDDFPHNFEIEDV